MLRMWLAKYKWAIYIGLLVLYTFGVWHICSGYQKNAYNKERLTTLQEQERLEKQNELLSRDLSAALMENQRLASKASAKTSKEITDEMAKHPNPPIPDSVRNKLNDTRNAGRSSAATLP